MKIIAFKIFCQHRRKTEIKWFSNYINKSTKNSNKKIKWGKMTESLEPAMYWQSLAFFWDDDNTAWGWHYVSQHTHTSPLSAHSICWQESRNFLRQIKAALCRTEYKNRGWHFFDYNKRNGNSNNNNNRVARTQNEAAAEKITSIYGCIWFIWLSICIWCAFYVQPID